MTSQEGSQQRYHYSLRIDPPNPAAISESKEVDQKELQAYINSLLGLPLPRTKREGGHLAEDLLDIDHIEDILETD